MKIGQTLFIILAVGYIGFEIYMVKKMKYRTEPTHIFSQHVEAAAAVDACGQLDDDRSDVFAKNFQYARGRAIVDIVPVAGEDAETHVIEQERALRQGVATMIEQQGCDDMEVWKLRKRYSNLARRVLPGAR